MMKRKTKFTGVLMCLICIGIIGLIFSGNALADSKKIRLNVGFGTEQVLDNLTLGPFAYGEMGVMFWPLVYDQLWVLGPAPDYKAIPSLATHWETDDYQTWRFYLREDAKFHDGTPLTAEDVAFTLWYLPRIPSWAFLGNEMDAKADVKVIDKYTVEFKLSRPYVGKYPPMEWMPMLPKHIWEPHKRKMGTYSNDGAIGSGPFKLKELKKSQFAWMEKNEEWWGEKPAVDEIVFMGLGGGDTSRMAMQKGEVEFFGYDGISLSAVEAYSKIKDVKLIVSQGIALSRVAFNLYKDTAVKDKIFRQAFMYNIDRDRINKLLHRGYSEDAYSFIYTESDEYNPNLPKYKFNPELAKKMLKDAGYKDTDGDGILNDKNGKNIVLEFMAPSDWTGSVKLITVIAEQMKEIGISIDAKVLDLDTYYEFVYMPEEKKFDLAVAYSEPGPNSSWVWEFCRSPNSGGKGWNQSGYANPEMDETMLKYNSEIDPKKRKELAFKLQAIMAEDLPYGIIDRPNVINPIRTDKFEGHVEVMGGISNWINYWTYMKLKPKK